MVIFIFYLFSYFGKRCTVVRYNSGNHQPYFLLQRAEARPMDRGGAARKKCIDPCCGTQGSSLEGPL